MKKHTALIILALSVMTLVGACNSGDAIVDPPLPVTAPPVTVSPVPPVTVTPGTPINCRRHPELCD